ncbi:hypothetical protein [Actinokineospora inagensis]|uniref:hypothetical protein n=1 Tax=Actinokineospora inagensis TaxID=103730 RepID=UPI00040D9F7C|nr:hypothetical protein [Actinokineospora inagensis]
MSLLTRLSSWSGIAAGLLIAIPSAVEIGTGETAATSFLLGISPALATPLLIALHLRQQQSSGSFGVVAFVLNTIGLSLFGGAAFMLNMGVYYLPDPVAQTLLHGPTMYALLGAGIVFSVGTVLFSVSMIRSHVHPRIPSITYGLALPVLALAAPLPDNWLISCVHITSGLTLLWLASALAAPSI